MYKELLAYDQTPERTSECLAYNATLVMHEFVYADVFPKDVMAHMTNAKVNLADLINLTFLLAEQKGWDWNNLADDGFTRFRERMAEIRKEGRK